MRKLLVLLLVVLLLVLFVVGTLPASADNGLPGEPWNRPNPGHDPPAEPPGWSTVPGQGSSGP